MAARHAQLITISIIILEIVQGSNFICNSTQSCFGQTLNCTAGEDCDVSCYHPTSAPNSDENVCGNTIINCPQDYSCYISTNQYEGLYRAVINGANNGDINLQCGDGISHKSWRCSEIAVNCGLNAYCNITTTDGSGNNIFNGAKIHGENAKQLNIHTDSPYALQGASIWCPISSNLDNNCNVHAVGSNRKLQYAKFYVNQSFSGINLICEHPTDPVTDCTGTTPPIMYCHDNSASCSFELEGLDSNDQWHCVSDPGNACGRYTYTPTIEPTNTPTIATNKPTISPTNNPSLFPTKYPTAITLNPSVFPTKYPSISPTDNTFSPTTITLNPTKYPSLSPTNNSLSPTAITLNPSKYPSLSPSKNPSLSPTKNPTKYPSLSPTKNPTISTNEPTTNPTNNPSNLPSRYPSSNPSFSPIPVYHFRSTIYSYSTLYQINNNNNDSNSFATVMIIVGVVILVGIAILIFIMYRRVKKERAGQKAMMIRVGSVSVINSESNTNKTVDFAKSISLISEPGSLSEFNEQKDDEIMITAAALPSTTTNINGSEEVKNWLSSIRASLTKYTNNFIDNGYTDLDYIQRIEQKSDLKDIGVILPAHQMIILDAIKKANEKNINTPRGIDANEGGEGGIETGATFDFEGAGNQIANIELQAFNNNNNNNKPDLNRKQTAGNINPDEFVV